MPETPSRPESQDPRGAQSDSGYGATASEPSPRQVDEELVRRAQGGDEAAFAELVSRHQTRVWRVARGLVRSDEDAQDIAQEAFLRVFRGLDRFDSKYAFTTWLHRIVTNLCIDHLRKQRGQVSLSRRADEDETEGLAQELPDHRDERPSDAIISREEAREVREVLDGLAEHFRTALVLREFEGLSCKEIADVVGATQVTVRWRLHRGRKLFLEAWNRRQDGDGERGNTEQGNQRGNENE
ncbi:MAG: sigma-70 family RNA polymerase sigma factor [Planctomycetes bacterium]|nr:sigma-70 family RNA polymerase sigma factor [Planctomycetota bacterium]